nr:hypothetical protein [Rickettsia endosymbiont of Ceutorhynchus assimilis]
MRNSLVSSFLNDAITFYNKLNKSASC